jgi:hypothetical protein
MQIGSGVTVVGLPHFEEQSWDIDPCEQIVVMCTYPRIASYSTFRFLCNTAIQRWTPRLEKEPPEVAKEILKLAGEDCFESDEHVIWKRVSTSE